jgi:hypothetical protein
VAENRLTSLDASFLEVERETAHMHVGWAAVFAPPVSHPRPSPEELRDHVESRLSRAPRYRQKVAEVAGPREPLYMLGSELEEAYPVVPIADRHAVAIGVTMIKDESFFGVYADCESVPDADLLAEGIDDSIEELLDLT